MQKGYINYNNSLYPTRTIDINNALVLISSFDLIDQMCADVGGVENLDNEVDNSIGFYVDNPDLELSDEGLINELKTAGHIL